MTSSQTSVAPAPRPEAPGVRRGFWGRVWGKVRRHPLRPLTAALVLLALGAGGFASARWFRGRGTSAGDGPGHHWGEAQRALEGHDVAGAARHLGECLKAWPFHAEAHFLLARASRRAGNRAGWERHLYRAAALEWPAEDIELERRLMRAQSGDLWGVEDGLWQQAQGSHPDQELILEALARGYLEINSYRDVLECAAFWLRRRPDAWLPRLYRGRTYHLSRLIDRAVPDYRYVLEHRPDHGQARLWLAGALDVDGRYREALAEFGVYLESHPGDPTALLGVAHCRFSLGELGEARAALEERSARHKEDAAGLLLRAKLDAAEGSPAKALAALKRAEALAPYETDVLEMLARTCRQLGDREQGERYQRKREDVNRLYGRLDDVRKRIGKDPENVALRYEAGLLLQRLGREDEAERWLRGLLRLDPDHRPTHRALADYYHKRGEVRRAEYHRRKADRGAGS
jgi:tetratricopeptide (TPR) repeat protein